MDRYDPGHICNGSGEWINLVKDHYGYMRYSDDGGRYAYDRQPSVCRWNLKKLSEALSTCLPEDKAEEMLKL